MTKSEEIYFRDHYASAKPWMAGVDQEGLIVHIAKTCYDDFRLACRRYVSAPSEGGKALVNEMYREAMTSFFNLGVVSDVDKIDGICARIWEEELAKARVRKA